MESSRAEKRARLWRKPETGGDGRTGQLWWRRLSVLPVSPRGGTRRRRRSTLEVLPVWWYGRCRPQKALECEAKTIDVAGKSRRGFTKHDGNGSLALLTSTYSDASRKHNLTGRIAPGGGFGGALAAAVERLAAEPEGAPVSASGYSARGPRPSRCSTHRAEVPAST